MAVVDLELEAVRAMVAGGRSVSQVGSGPAQGSVGGTSGHDEREHFVLWVSTGQRDVRRRVLGRRHRLGIRTRFAVNEDGYRSRIAVLFAVADLELEAVRAVVAGSRRVKEIRSRAAQCPV